jgi:hypothetical protein
VSHGMPTGPALEQLREVVVILRELGNAGPRDQSFKQWRQVSVTLLQRIWPDDAGKAARFRRIPFSPPSSRADAKTIRECYERGVCEAIAFLDSLIEELEAGGKPGLKLVRPVEEPLAEPEIHPDTFGAELPFAPVDPPPAVQQALEREPHALPPAPPPAAHAPPPTAAHVPPPSAEQTPWPAHEDAPKPGRAKQRLKDMLGFSDEAPAASAPTASAPPRPAASAPAPRPVAPPPPAAAAPPRPVAPAPPPPAAPPRTTATTGPPQRLPFKRFEPPPVPVREEIEPEPPEDLPTDLPTDRDEATVDEAPEWTAPVVAFPGHKVVVGRPSPAPAPPPQPESYDQGDPEEVYDLDFDLHGEVEIDSEPPPATLREMLDRAPVRRPVAPPPVVRELLAMARSVDDLGVPRERRAMVRAALSDLGQQMETPPVQWSAIRQTMAFVLDYPLIARRVIPLLLPYLDEAA